MQEKYMANILANVLSPAGKLTDQIVNTLNA
jgi:hypothetical protein